MWWHLRVNVSIVLFIGVQYGNKTSSQTKIPIWRKHFTTNAINSITVNIHNALSYKVELLQWKILRPFSPWYRNQQSHKLHGNSRRKSNDKPRPASHVSALLLKFCQLCSLSAKLYKYITVAFLLRWTRFYNCRKNKGGFYAHALNCKPTSFYVVVLIPLSESFKKRKHEKRAYELKFREKTQTQRTFSQRRVIKIKVNG